jgi:hypothetical protein
MVGQLWYGKQDPKFQWTWQWQSGQRTINPQVFSEQIRVGGFKVELVILPVNGVSDLLDKGRTHPFVNLRLCIWLSRGPGAVDEESELGVKPVDYQVGFLVIVGH